MKRLLKRLYDEFWSYIQKEDYKKIEKAVEYYLGEENFSINRTILDILKQIKDQPGMLDLYNKVLVECEKQLNKKLY